MLIRYSAGTNLTFLLGDEPYGYSSFEVGLFAACGIGSIIAAPYAGKLCDRVLPWLGTLIGAQWILTTCRLPSTDNHFSSGLLIGLATACIALGAAKLSLGAVIVVCICRHRRPLVYPALPADALPIHSHGHCATDSAGECYLSPRRPHRIGSPAPSRKLTCLIRQVGNQARIFSLDSTARGRINGVYTSGVFLGQVMGSSAGEPELQTPDLGRR